jgi:hypothetical protein
VGQAEAVGVQEDHAAGLLAAGLQRLKHRVALVRPEIKSNQSSTVRINQNKSRNITHL